jgi:hypothetical protein
MKLDEVERIAKKLKEISAKWNEPIFTAEQNPCGEIHIDGMDYLDVDEVEAYEEFRRALAKGRIDMEDAVWITQKGQRIRVSEMTTQHIFNSLNMCRRNAENGDRAALFFIPKFSKELIKRFRE